MFQCGVVKELNMSEITRREVVLMLAGVPHIACGAGEHRIRLAGVDLSGLDLRALNLAYADFAGADLRGCDLSDARLYGCDFSGADLTGAILRGVYAERAVFAGACLRNADFRPSARNLFFGTNLICADFQSADLLGTSFDGADLAGAVFDDENFPYLDMSAKAAGAQTANESGYDDIETLRITPSHARIQRGIAA
jgi:uncharacterized protein YjbI with pentapeptide repeats